MTKRQNLLASRHRRELKSKACLYKGGKCEICGYDKALGALCFHHKDPGEKEFSFGHRTRSDWESLQKELDKCILLCVRCHAEIHDEIHLKALNDTELELNVPRKNYHPGFRTCKKCKQLYEKTYENQSRCGHCKNQPSQRLGLNIENIQKLALNDTVLKIAQTNNCSPQTVRRFCKKNGIRVGRPTRPTKITWPSDNELSILVNTKPLIFLAKDLGVSDNAIKKRCKKLNIQLPPMGFWLRK